MRKEFQNKSTLDDIRKKFDNSVGKYSNLETGQTTTVDAPLAMELITRAAVASTTNIKRVLDIGCGAGNNTLKLLEYVKPFDSVLVDLSLPMLNKAEERISAVNPGKTITVQGDFRNAPLPFESYDVILAAATLHHLRDDNDWKTTFQRLYSLTAPGGSIWITDLISHETTAVQSIIQEKYGEYLASYKGEIFRDKVFRNIAKEDTPRPVTYQLDLLRKVGFKHVELLHKNSCFAAFGAIK